MGCDDEAIAKESDPFSSSSSVFSNLPSTPNKASLADAYTGNTKGQAQDTPPYPEPRATTPSRVSISFVFYFWVDGNVFDKMSKGCQFPP
ncbi:hypothetical protein Patl1_32044 [Pistacia atlantica]|uniref:Uncharacterized protein n=1 Tax=Pistacia atlantica TaxID=434234 RepID=A0ACC1AP42_9ROSI|nr:hypothetical protein Patl1_32044 [Pistacia atlantica]